MSHFKDENQPHVNYIPSPYKYDNITSQENSVTNHDINEHVSHDINRFANNNVKEITSDNKPTKNELYD